MSKRIISGLVGAAFVLALLCFDQSYPAFLNLCTAAVSFLAIRELFAVINVPLKSWQAIISLIFAVALPLFSNNICQQTWWYIYTVGTFAGAMLKPEIKLKDICAIYMMTGVIAFSLAHIIMLRDFGREYGTFYAMLGLAVAWMSDTGAYFSGKMFGKNKLCPEISPKKTIEGFFGGIVVCVISLVLIAFIFNNFIFASKCQINYVWIIIIGLIGSPISAFGDLCFSMIKRRCKVKDFGNLMPGHGGVLDRFDSVIFTVPFVYIFVNIIHIIK